MTIAASDTPAQDNPAIVWEGPDELRPLLVPVDQLEPLPGNPRRGDVDAVARSLQRFGQRKNITRRPEGITTAGNHTRLAALQLGWTHLAVVTIDETDAEAKAWALADNRSSDLATNDDADLAAMLSEVAAADAALLAAASYTDEDLAALLASLDVPTPDPEPDPVPLEPPADPVTKRGDVWQLGPHRVMCGDCRDAGDVNVLLAGAAVNLAVTSPPYAEQREYDEASGFVPIPPAEYVEWFAPVASIVADHLAPDGSWLVNIKAPGHDLDVDLYVLDLVVAHVRAWGWHFAAEFCWERNGVPGRPTRRLKNQFEPIYQFARGEWKFRPEAVRYESANVPLYDASGPGDNATLRLTRAGTTQPNKPRPRRENRSTQAMSGMQGAGADVGEALVEGLAYPGNRLPTFAGSHEATGHSAAFPVGLPAFFTGLFTDPGDVVYDPFCGSGSTILAADQEGRVGYGMELSPAYVDVIVARWERHTGGKAELVEGAARG